MSFNEFKGFDDPTRAFIHADVAPRPGLECFDDLTDREFVALNSALDDPSFQEPKSVNTFASSPANSMQTLDGGDLEMTQSSNLWEGVAPVSGELNSFLARNNPVLFDDNYPLTADPASILEELFRRDPQQGRGPLSAADRNIVSDAAVDNAIASIIGTIGTIDNGAESSPAHLVHSIHKKREREQERRLRRRGDALGSVNGNANGDGAMANENNCDLLSSGESLALDQQQQCAQAHRCPELLTKPADLDGSNRAPFSYTLPPGQQHPLAFASILPNIHLLHYARAARANVDAHMPQFPLDENVMVDRQEEVPHLFSTIRTRTVAQGG